MQGKIKENLIYSEYLPETVQRLKALGGSWNAEESAWNLGDRAAAAFDELFGNGDCVTVTVPADKAEVSGNFEHIGGYVLAVRRSRNLYPRCADGVTLAEGKFTERGGSMKYPIVDGVSGDVVYRLEVRRSFAERFGLEIEFETKENPLAKFTLEELQAEIERRKEVK